MKKIFILFAMLPSVMASAQGFINIEMLGATYTASPAVKFRVSWNSVPVVAGQIHHAKVWVWIDLMKTNAANSTAGSTWSRAEISGTPSVSSSPATAATLDATTNKGFWLNGVPGSYSATVTATLSNIPANAQFNWCAYASDCPPQAVIKPGGGYDLKGMPPFIVNGTKLPDGVITFGAGTCITKITDATDNPAGIIPSLPAVTASAASSACAGAAVVFTATASGGTTTAMTYTWDIAGSPVSTNTGTYSRTFSTTGNHTYSVSVKNSNNCTNVSSVKNIVVNTSAARNESASPCGCSAGLTACNGYCRDLAADGAICHNNLEITRGCMSRDYPDDCYPQPGWQRYLVTTNVLPSVLKLLQFNEREYAWSFNQKGVICRYKCNIKSCYCAPTQREWAMFLQYR
ncbi:MAG: PKD domain-containing protein [Prevotellaceae bacterium]|nr:PKD domain-containing protein [Prevotellaceae bacterium]